ncbi:MAG TPA: hypothetical protein VKE22_00630 [Haliangiales bacterium]|nr:hypothetical protein [Haliangiales bacterium]
MVPPGAPTPRELLETPRTLALGKASTIEVTAHRDIGGEATQTSELAVTGGDLTVHADAAGKLVVDKLSLSLADVWIDSMNFGLTGLKVTVASEGPAQTAWTADEHSAAATGTVALQLDWSLAAFGRVLPLATLRLEHIPVMLTVSIVDAHHITLTVQGQEDGMFWSWAGLVELSNLAIHIEAGTP